MMKTIVYLALGLILSLYSCQNSEKSAENQKDSTLTNNNETGTEIKKEDLEFAYSSAKDSMDKAWKMMIDQDDRLIKDIQRLLTEVSYCKKYNVLLQDSLSKAASNLSNVRYKQYDMTDVQINQYDLYSDQVIKRSIALVQATKEMQSHTITETLLADIMEGNNQVPSYRLLYDRFAFSYNDFVTKYKNQLISINPKYNDLKPVPVFTINENKPMVQ